jgi:predicted ribosomally synthesized peptide with nif11-like leader
MSSDNLNALLETIGSDPSLKAQLLAATSIEEAIAVAHAAGINLEPSDLLAARNIQMPELSDAELEAVAGGATDKWVGSCNGSCNTDKRVNCC